jgi:hypothetical protein
MSEQTDACLERLIAATKEELWRWQHASPADRRSVEHRLGVLSEAARIVFEQDAFREYAR